MLMLFKLMFSYRELFNVKVYFFKYFKLTYTKLVAFLEKISNDLQIVLKYPKPDPTTAFVDNTKIELQEFYYFVLSCSILQFLQTEPTLKRYYTNSLSSDCKITSYLLEKATFKIQICIIACKAALHKANKCLTEKYN